MADDTQTQPDSQPPSDPPETPAPNADNERRFTQADLDRVVRERLERERKAAADKAAKDREQAEAERLKEQGEFKALAEQHERRAKELEPVAARVERYEAALNAHLATQRNGLPDHILPLLERMDPVEQLEYLAANRDKLIAAAPAQPAGANTNGQPPRPIPGTPRASEPTPAQITEEAMNAARRNARYAPL